METVSIITALVFLSIFGMQQEQGIQDNNISKTEISQQLHQHADTVHATFPGGESALATFLKENIQNPLYNPENRPFTGNIQVTFAITTTGKVVYYRILNSPNKDISNEIKRVVKLMPEWNPASLDGKIITDSAKVWFPFVYKKE